MDSQSTATYWQKFWPLGMTAHVMEVAALMLEILVAVSVLATPFAILLWNLGF